MAEESFRMELQQLAGYRFTVRFDDPAIPPLNTDEPPPLGTGTGPNPARLLGTAVANCLAASLLFALRKYGNDPTPMRAVVTVTLGRNAQGRTRVTRIGVELVLGVPAASLKHADRALAQYEDFCVVTGSVRAGIDVDVTVRDSLGAQLRAEPALAAP
ncbi:OsmC family protein [Caenimonas aquaedulcis]|uniref:OsmC family protein n=1 Tax=Caenimonas aquaedulcis TaxID=2793270 RepID=UPI00338FB70C